MDKKNNGVETQNKKTIMTTTKTMGRRASGGSQYRLERESTRPSEMYPDRGGRATESDLWTADLKSRSLSIEVIEVK